MKLKTALFVLVSAVSVAALSACAKKEAQEEQAAVPAQAASEAEQDLPVTDTPVSEDMMDAAPLETEDAGASEAVK